MFFATVDAAAQERYGTGQDGQYCYPNSDMLVNKLGITEEDALEATEIELSQARIDQYEPNFDDISLPAPCAQFTSIPCAGTI